MRVRRWTTAGVALVATLSLAIAGCSGSDGSDGSAGSGGSRSARSADPKQALADSVKELAKGDFSFTIVDNESTMTGVLHAPSKSASIEVKSKPGTDGLEMNLVMVGPDRWLKFDFEPEVSEALKLPADKWLHVDSAKITDPETAKDFAIDFGDPTTVDLASAGAILKSLVTAERAGEGKYSGTLDLTQVKDAKTVDGELVKSLGEKGKSIPFTASVDGQGRLTQLVLDIPAAGTTTAYKLEIDYADYGSATAPKQPAAGEAVEAPASLYDALNG